MHSLKRPLKHQTVRELGGGACAWYAPCNSKYCTAASTVCTEWILIPFIKQHRVTIPEHLASDATARWENENTGQKRPRLAPGGTLPSECFSDRRLIKKNNNCVCQEQSRGAGLVPRNSLSHLNDLYSQVQRIDFSGVRQVFSRTVAAGQRTDTTVAPGLFISVSVQRVLFVRPTDS